MRNPDYNKLKAAAKSANILEFILSTPNKFDTKLTSGISSISGGQSQRIAIARARYHNPSLLLLDEFTSALDEASEKKIMNEIFADKRKDYITIMTSHKPSLVNRADFILDVNSGEISKLTCLTPSMSIKAFKYISKIFFIWFKLSIYLECGCGIDLDTTEF